MSKEKGEVGIEADGKRYTLAFSINALCELEEKLGDAVADLGSMMSGRKRWTTLRTVFWCALTDHHPEMTEKEAGKIISALGISQADGLVAEAFKLAFPEASTVPLGVKPAPAGKPARTGSRS